MFNLLKKLTGTGIGKKKAAPGTEKKGGEALTPEKTWLAACVILLEAAHSDYECTDDEVEHVLGTISANYDLSPEYAHELLELARTERKQSVDLWEFTNRVNQNYSHPEKLLVMEAVWSIVYSDGKLDKHEDYFARKLSTLLRLSHKEMIEQKIKAKKRLNL